MDSDKTELKQSETNSGKIFIKKSMFSALVISVIAVSLIAAFFAGSYISLKSDEITKSELNEAIAKLESKILKNQQVSERPNVQPISVSIDDDPIRGNQDAPITIVEFSDFQCPFCARFQIQTLPLILEQYVETGKVKFVYRDFPIQNSHPNAMPAAAASECAHEQDKYWEYHDALFENQGVWNNVEITSAITVFKEFATELDLNQEQFNSCLDSGKYIEEVSNDLRDGKDYGVTGTPGFFIGNEEMGFVKLNGAQPFEAFKSVIDSQLNTG
ncbi:MAG: DsbA family protein [Thermoproteota archaeon]